MFNLHIDTETIPTQDESCISEIKAGIKPPANYKKAETIQKWLSENGERAGNEAVHKTSFDGGLGQTFCIQVAKEEEDVQIFKRNDLSEGSEIKMFSEFNDFIGKIVHETSHQPYFIGHNISGFDLRFIFQRMVIHRIKPKFIIPCDDAAYKGSYFDTMTKWAGFNGKIKLDTLCKYLGVKTPKNGIDGSQVWEYVQAGKFQEIWDYGRDDVIAIREVYKKLTFNE